VKATTTALWTVAVLAAFALGRWVAPGNGVQPTAPRAGGLVETVGEALAERDALQRAYALSGALQGLDEHDVSALARLLEERHRQLSRENVRLVMMAWSRIDAPGAFEWARQQPGKWGQTMAAEAIYAWGFRAGGAPLASLEGIEEGDNDDLRQRLLASALDGWLASGDHEGASAHIAAIEDPRVRRKRGLILASEVARDGPEALIAWA